MAVAGRDNFLDFGLATTCASIHIPQRSHLSLPGRRRKPAASGPANGACSLSLNLSLSSSNPAVIPSERERLVLLNSIHRGMQHSTSRKVSHPCRRSVFDWGSGDSSTRVDDVPVLDLMRFPSLSICCCHAKGTRSYPSMLHHHETGCTVHAPTEIYSRTTDHFGQESDDGK